MIGTHIEFRDIKARTNTCHARRTPQVRESENDPNELWRGLLDKRDTWAVMEPCTLQLVVLLWTCRNDLLRIRELGRLIKIKHKKLDENKSWDDASTYVLVRVLKATKDDISRTNGHIWFPRSNSNDIILCCNSEKTRELWVETHSLTNVSTKQLVARRIVLLAHFNKLGTISRTLLG